MHKELYGSQGWSGDRCCQKWHRRFKTQTKSHSQVAMASSGGCALERVRQKVPRDKEAQVIRERPARIQQPLLTRWGHCQGSCSRFKQFWGSVSAQEHREHWDLSRARQHMQHKYRCAGRAQEGLLPAGRPTQSINGHKVADREQKLTLRGKKRPLVPGVSSLSSQHYGY